MIRSKLGPLFVLVVSVLAPGIPGAAPAGALAQVPTLHGTVIGTDGEPVSAVRVELLHIDADTTAERVTDALGRWEFADLEAGAPYRLTFRSTGYQTRTEEVEPLAPEERRRVDVALEAIAFQLEGIRVTADRRFDPDLSGPAMVVNREQVRAHPVIERNLLELATLSTVAQQTNSQGGISISGQNERNNSILIDGALSQDVFGASPSGVPGAAARAKPIPMDAVEQFRIEAAPSDVGVSGFTGGVMSASTRSGTDDWQGSVFSEYRNEAFFGSLELDGANVAPEEFTRHIWGFDVGGPIARDRAYLFTAAEFENRSEPAPGFTRGVHAPLATGLLPDSIDRVSEVLANRYGIDAGGSGQLALRNPLANLFSRLDLEISETQLLTLRYNYAGAQRDSTPNRSPVGAYEFSSAGYRAESSSHALTGEWTTEFGDGHANQLTANVQRIAEEALPESLVPQIDVTLRGALDGIALRRDVRAGSRYFSQYNTLDQTIVQLANRTSFDRGDLRTSLGIGVDYFGFDHDFRPGGRGYYRFDDLRALEDNAPSYYEVNLPTDPDADPTVQFSVVQPHVFFQNEHDFPDGLVLYYGMRLDLPIFRGAPEYNAEIDQAFGMRTDRLPDVSRTFSPRLGFNWQPDNERRTQFRGTFGLFTANLPYVWMADAIRHSGLEQRYLTCSLFREYVPGLDPDQPLPTSCPDARGQQEHRRVVGFREDFRLPRELKVTLALDQELPGGFVFTGEALFIPTFTRTAVRDLNLPGPGASGDRGYTPAFGSRAHYGYATPRGYGSDRRIEGFSQVLQIENEKRAALAWGVTAQLEKDVAQWLTLTGSVSFSRTKDEQSLGFGDMATNLAATPVGRIANQYTARPANFDRPRKYLLNARMRLPERFGGAQVSLLYSGQSGQPYSYVYNSDINGDGFPGPGLPLDASNDLLFVPSDPLDIPGTLPTRQLFNHLVTEVEPCLADVRGEIMERNSCRTPMSHMLDLSVTQPFEVRGARFEVGGDLLNMLNMLNSEWGRVWEVDPVIPILDIIARQDFGQSDYVPSSEPVLGYTGPRVRDVETGAVRPALPHNLIVPASQWQAQLGVRVFF